MLAATKVKMSGSEKKKTVNKNTYDSSSIKHVTRKFHVVVVQNKRKEMYKCIRGGASHGTLVPLHLPILCFCFFFSFLFFFFVCVVL